jgi:hypothetical protein
MRKFLALDQNVEAIRSKDSQSKKRVFRAVGVFPIKLGGADCSDEGTFMPAVS